MKPLSLLNVTPKDFYFFWSLNKKTDFLTEIKSDIKTSDEQKLFRI